MRDTRRFIATGLFCGLFVLTAAAQEGREPVFDAAGALEQARTLTGDQRLACEALLCLATTSRPPECRPSIRRLFSISRPNRRLRFLRSCPSTEGNPGMDQLAQLTAEAWPTCTASWLNVNHVYSIGDDGPFVKASLPESCSAYNQHGWTMPQSMPRYVGHPEEGGRWVDQ